MVTKKLSPKDRAWDSTRKMMLGGNTEVVLLWASEIIMGMALSRELWIHFETVIPFIYVSIPKGVFSFFAALLTGKIETLWDNIDWISVFIAVKDLAIWHNKLFWMGFLIYPIFAKFIYNQILVSTIVYAVLLVLYSIQDIFNFNRNKIIPSVMPLADSNFHSGISTKEVVIGGTLFKIGDLIECNVKFIGHTAGVISDIEAANANFRQINGPYIEINDIQGNIVKFPVDFIDISSFKAALISEEERW